METRLHGQPVASEIHEMAPANRSNHVKTAQAAAAATNEARLAFCLAALFASSWISSSRAAIRAINATSQSFGGDWRDSPLADPSEEAGPMSDEEFMRLR